MPYRIKETQNEKWFSMIFTDKKTGKETDCAINMFYDYTTGYRNVTIYDENGEEIKGKLKKKIEEIVKKEIK